MSIQVVNVSYSIQNRAILQDINLELFPYKIHTILGRNGTGKSTLLKIISGGLKPSSGQVFINSREVFSYNVLELSKIRAYLSQEVILSVPLLVQEVVELGRTPYFNINLTRKDKDISVLSLRLVGNLPLKYRNILEVSGGEKQRTHIARILAQILNEKSLVNKYLFLDESFSNLDIHHQIHILQLLQTLSKRGLGIIMTLHDLNLAANFSDHCTILKEGKILATGKSSEILIEPILEEAYQYPMKVMYDLELQRTFILPKITNQGVKNGRSKQVF